MLTFVDRVIRALLLVRDSDHIVLKASANATEFLGLECRIDRWINGEGRRRNGDAIRRRRVGR